MFIKAQWVAIVLIGTSMGLVGGGLVACQMLKVPLQRLSMTTPVFVLDRAKLIQALPPNATADQMANAVADLKKLSAKLSASGYLVIDATAVIAAPDDVYVRQDGK
jgi:hypothetical protein